MGRRFGVTIASCLLSATAAGAAESGETVKVAPASSEAARTVTVVPGAGYRAGWFYGFFLGDHWRNTWTTPVEAPLLSLDTFDGGLRPDRQGGGMETTNLHFKSANGNTWAFRSVDKDPSRTLDPDTRDSWIGDLFRDQVSTAQPYGALLVPPLLGAAGILHATPQLAVLPDDPRLGEFQQYAGMLGLLEERLERRIEGATMVSDTLTLFQRLEERSDERVDARAYLRARLIDVLVGDWDRHVEQWKWARFEKDGQRVWEPVPRDRDQAFSRFDGVVPSLAEYYTKQLSGFSPTYSPIDKVTFAGRYTDRRFLVALDKKDWEAVTSEVVAKLTDEVISEAVHGLPPEVYEKDGSVLESALRSRRDRLTEASRDFYRLLADRVDVRGTGRDEEIRVERQAGGSVEIALYDRDRRTGKSAAAPFFDRTFRPEETSEVRLYTMGGEDHIDVEGAGDKTISIRVVAPERSVEVSDRSSDPSAIHLYSPLPEGPVNPKPGPKVVDRETAVLTNRYETFRDWGSDALFYPQFGYDSDRGLVAGAILQRTAYGFQLDPYSSVMNFGAAYSTATNRPRLEYTLDLRTRSPVRGLLYVAYSGMDTVKYYGQGNESVRDSALDSGDFYKLRQEIFVANPVIEVPLFGPLRGRMGVLFKHASDVSGSGIIAATQPEGSGGMSLGSGEIGLVMDTREGIFPHTSGVSFQVTARHTPEIFSNPSAFTKLRGAVSGSVGGHVLTDVQLNGRVAGEKNWGTYPFFESAFIGGAVQGMTLDLTGATTGNTLRGYALNRYAGDASVVGNAEVQAALGKFHFGMPWRWGLDGLADVGRVFLAGESSSKWHAGYGGGIWLGIFASGMDFQFASAIKATVVHSDEGTSFYLLSGFAL
jgi:hypothetical protein